MVKMVRAGVDDLEVLLRFREEIHVQHEAAEPDVYRPFEREAVSRELAALLSEESMEFWLARRDDVVLGCVHWQLEERPATPVVRARTVGMVHQFGVLPQGRRQGVGRAMMRHVERRAASLGASHVSLSVRALNEGARRFYEAMGYDVLSMKMWRGLEGG